MDSNSYFRILRTGTPQDTRSGLNDFKLLINDLPFNTDYITYAGDVTAALVSVEPNDPALLHAADQLFFWCNENRMIPNTKKTRECLCILIENLVKNLYRK
jgi:hypothetical protein